MAPPRWCFPGDYLDDGHLTHGYALTVHKAQRATRRTFVLGSPDMACELGDVAASRHTDQARFYINVGSDENLDRPPLPGLEDHPLYEELERTLERAKALAFDEPEAGAETRCRAPCAASKLDGYGPDLGP